jgi:hypothetical protein
LLIESPALDGFDLFSLSYRSGLFPNVHGVWTGDPDLQTLATFLQTVCAHPPLARYKALVLLAHSMGGLVVQRALLDQPALASRTSHVLLFATSSNGLTKAGWLRWAKHQVRDMEAGGSFIRQLRHDWRQRWNQQPPFRFWAVAGDNDLFVPVDFCLDPFHRSQQSVIPGDHLSIVLSGDSENWSGGDTKTGPPRGASQAGRQGQRRGAISGADGCGDGGADPSGRGGDAAALSDRLGPPPSGKLSPVLLTTRGLKERSNASLQRGCQS